jgi:hypothetical protein
MSSVLEMQGLSPIGGDLYARSNKSWFKCGKTSESKLSLAWCGTNVVA